jgi:hypothetical protein
MAGAWPGHPRLCCCNMVKTWMPGTSNAKTRFALLPGHDGDYCFYPRTAARPSGGAANPALEA